MKIQFVDGDAFSLTAPLHVIVLSEGERPSSVPQAFRAVVESVFARGDFKGQADESLVIPGAGDDVARILLVGLGIAADVTTERYRRVGGTVAGKAGSLKAARVVVVGSSANGSQWAAFAEGAILGAWRFDELRSSTLDKEAVALDGVDIAVTHDAKGARQLTDACIIANAENRARRMAMLPGNRCTPTFLASQAEEIAAAHGLEVTILDRAGIVAAGLTTLATVALGSEEEPRFIVLRYRSKRGGQPLAIVGKGLTFDAGGISIKPAGGMEEMKFDMAGGAAVLAAMDAIGQLKPNIDVIAVVPSSENLLGGKAMKPGDVVVTHSGKTVEIVNTDAEGRLILSDALSWVQQHDPAAIVDCATLTGAVLVALGHVASAVLTTDDGLASEIEAAGNATGERVWRLPLWPEFKELNKSDVADVKNTGGRDAGTITAAQFLHEFSGDRPWAHLDIAGTAWRDGKLSYESKGATGIPTRLLVQWVLTRAAT